MNKTNLEQKAKDILQDNWTGHFTKPAPSLYPHQWNWDSGFIALGYGHYDLDRAQQEIRSLFRGQWSNGMLPQIVFRPERETDGRYFPGADFWQTKDAEDASQDPITSGITMPPVHGFVLWHLWINSGEDESLLPFLKELFPKVTALHEYLYAYRDPEDEGLVYIRHPWEPGTDNSPTWDEALQNIPLEDFKLPSYEREDLQNKKAAAHRPTDDDYDRYVLLVDLFRKNKYDEEAIDEICPFKIQDPLFNGILCYSNECMAKLAEVLDEDPEDFHNWHSFTRSALNNKLWNRVTARYDSFDLVQQKLIPTYTANSYIPLLGGVPDPQQAQRMMASMMEQHINQNGNGNQNQNENQNQNDYWLCPSYEIGRDDFNFEKYWRGPIWININWMLWHGLKRYAFEEDAEMLKNNSLELIEQFGFYEYFDPRKSIAENGYGTGSFSWSAALYIDFLNSKV